MSGLGLLFELARAERDQPVGAATLWLNMRVLVSPVAMMRLCVIGSSAGEIIAYWTPPGEGWVL